MSDAQNDPLGQFLAGSHFAPVPHTTLETGVDAMAAAAGHLRRPRPVLRVLVLSFAASTSGGIARDLLIMDSRHGASRAVQPGA